MNELLWSTESYQNTATDRGSGIIYKIYYSGSLCLCSGTAPAKQAALLWLSIKVID